MSIPPRILKVNTKFLKDIQHFYRKPKDSLKNQVFRLDYISHIYIVYLSFLPLVVGIYAEPSESNYRHFFVKIAGP